MADVPPAMWPSPVVCNSLEDKLKVIWDEIGEDEPETGRMILQLNQECLQICFEVCLDIYRRKLEQTRKQKADLLQSLAEYEAEVANLLSALGETPSFSRVCTVYEGTIKEQLSAVALLEI